MNKLLCFIILAIFSSISANAVIQDTLVEETISKQNLSRPLVNLNYNYQSVEKIPIHLKILENLSTKNAGVYEGQILKFVVKKDVKHNNCSIVKKGTIAAARIETYTSRGMNGIPASIVIDNFDIPGIDKNKIKEPFIKKGQSRTLLVLPIKWALTPIPGVGSLTNFILGGNASLTDKDNITIYYYPEWN